jgi:heat shock protein HtpX
MWEAIQANKRRSVVLIFAMAAVLVGLGYAIGLYFAPEYAYAGVGIAAVVWALLWMTAMAGGDGIMLSSVHAREIQHDDYPILFNVVEEMTIAAGLPKMPKVYIIDTDAPNAFAVGKESNAAVAVTSGLLMRLNRDELQGVIAHEIGHIKNHDTRFMVLAGVMMGAIILLADIFVRSMFYSGGGSRRRSSKGGGGQGILLVVALVFAILAPILAQILYFACSRRREYLADASGARFTRYPEGLASALEKIAGSAGKMSKVSRTVAPMFTVNPLKGAAAHSLFSTHPPTGERCAILRAMGGAAYADYEAAFERAQGSSLLGERTVAESHELQKRGPSVEPERDDMERAREAVDVLHRMEGMLFLACTCGMKIKVPKSHKGKEVNCPRCGNGIPVPVAAAAIAGAAAAGEEILGPAAGAATAPETTASRAEPLTYTYRPGQWQSFRCECDWAINLSPNFKGSHVRCPGCNRDITIERA